MVYLQYTVNIQKLLPAVLPDPSRAVGKQRLLTDRVGDMRRIRIKNKHAFLRNADAICTVVGLVLSLQLNPLVSETTIAWARSLLFLALAVSRVLVAFQYNRAVRIKELCFAGVYLLCALLCAILRDELFLCRLSICVFYAVVIANRIFSLSAPPRKIRKFISNILLILLALGIVSLLLILDEYGLFLLTMFSVSVAIKSLFHIISISFSQIKRNALRKIIRKTYVMEILFGLVLLIISFSSYFTAMEPGIESYFDALWFCFAVVTTIGFGDYTVVLPFSRFLTVVLGIYGIVVVALLTSVIVNFYSETKNEKEPDEDPKTDEDPGESSG